VIRIDPAEGVVEAEGMMTYEALADATLAHGTMPAVVPQLKSITLGGAVAGVGIEASSFRRGLVHHTIAAIEVLTADGRVVRCTPDNEHRDLFFGFPNSYGTLGYALGVTARTIPVQPFVALEHVRFSTAAACFDDIARRCDDTELDFLDGVVFAQDEIYLTLGRFIERAPHTSDYTFESVYYQSIRERSNDFLTIRDYLWRWDTDWFWCSRPFGVQKPLVRMLWPRRYRRSDVYRKLVALDRRYGLSRRADAEAAPPVP
jgi:FAD/FMN-containing dehydrogenases